MTLSSQQSWSILIALVSAGLLVCGTLVWVMRDWVVPPLPSQSASPVVEMSRNEVLELDPANWEVVLWQALKDPPPRLPVEQPKAPMTAGLIAIAERDGLPVAVIELEPGGMLYYLRVGDRAGAYQIESIETDAVVIQYDGDSVRLELPR